VIERQWGPCGITHMV